MIFCLVCMWIKTVSYVINARHRTTQLEMQWLAKEEHSSINFIFLIVCSSSTLSEFATCTAHDSKFPTKICTLSKSARSPPQRINQNRLQQEICESGSWSKTIYLFLVSFCVLCKRNHKLLAHKNNVSDMEQNSLRNICCIAALDFLPEIAAKLFLHTCS